LVTYDVDAVNLWPLQPDTLDEWACRAAGRNLTWHEWKQYFPKRENYPRTCPDLPVHYTVIDKLIEEGSVLVKTGNIKGAVAKVRQAKGLGNLDDLDPVKKAQQLAVEDLIAQGEALAREQEDIESAADKFKNALELDPTLDFDPEAKAQRLAAQGLVAQGEALAREQGDIEGAAAQFKSAQELDPSLVLTPESEARRVAAQGLIERGKALAMEGNIESAVAQLKSAQELDPSLTLTPEAEVAQNLLTRGEELARQGQIDQAIAAYKEAQTIYRPVEITAYAWNTLCRFGSLGGKAADIIDYCDRAVKLAPDDGWIRNDRGVARALLGNYAGAIEDFNFFVAWSKANGFYDQFGEKRKIWIADLKADQNPFDAVTLAELQNE
jgi:tetratricopeptide (TPR) repeat protein